MVMVSFLTVGSAAGLQAQQALKQEREVTRSKECNTFRIFQNQTQE